jgi:transposase
VETIGKIRRRRLVHGDSISAIARDLGLARNTVKRALRFEGDAYEYRRKRQPVPKLGPYVATLDAWLEAEEKLPARERRTAQRMFEALRLEGYPGAVDAVRRHMRGFERRRHPIATAFIPQTFAPGEAYQFDWSHEHVELGGVEQVVKVAHVRLCHSRAFFLVAYPRESQEMVFDAHARAFSFLGGVPRRGIYDNLKPAVDAIFVGKERRYNRRFLVMCNHYLIEPTACTPAAGWEKGQVENQVGNVREWLFTPKLRCTDLSELNAHLAARCGQLACERSHPDQPERKVVQVWDEERAALRATPAPFDGFAERSVRISATCLVSFERNRYSVECRYVGQVASVRAYAERIVVVCGAEVIAEHLRSFERGRTLYNPWHYVAALERKPGALRNGAPFKDWNLPGSLTRLRERLAKHADGDRQFVDILLMVSLYGLDAVSDACASALDEQVVSSAHVVNLLHRAAHPPRPAILQVPEALKLTVEPAANCDRYNQLLKPRRTVTLTPIDLPVENNDASPTDRTTQDPAPAWHGERAGGQLDGPDPEEARPDQLASPTPAGGDGRSDGALLSVPVAPGALPDAAGSGQL